MSATNYGWGPNGIGDRTDIPDWPEWFYGPESPAVLTALYQETGQNVGDFGSWSRLDIDPGGENDIVLFKSCFPNSDLFGNPDDPPAAEPNDQLTVGNAKAVYNRLQGYFETRQDKLFVVITAPPQNENAYAPDIQTPAERAANARAFNHWLVHDWLDAYPHQNVAVFDYFNVLTAPDNHHHWSGAEIRHEINTQNPFSHYPAVEGDSHPSSAGHQKATAEFVPLLNIYYHRWKSGVSEPEALTPSVLTTGVVSVTADAASLSGTVNPNGAATTAYFQFGETTAYTRATPPDSVGAGTTGVSVEGALSGLSPATTYHVRLVAQNPLGTAYGEDRVFTTASAPAPATGRIRPEDLVYCGAFRLPDGAGDCDWTYSGHGMTYYPGGDPGGPDDGYPGSLFATGNDAVCQHVSEIAIPAPAVSPAKNPADLPTAAVLQPFQDIRNNLFGDHQNLVIPRVGLAYLPARGAQTTGKLHFCWGQHIQDFEASHGWCDPDLSNPRTAGPWVFGGYTNYVTNDYLFDIPSDWADAQTPGLYLASGRAREGPWSGRGPALFAYGPWNDGNPPSPNATLSQITPLLLYGVQETGIPEITSDASMEINGYQDSDHWFGGAWLTAGDNAAVIIVGTKALGSSWYGFANGVVWAMGCGEPGMPDCPAVPDWPYDDRGFWAEGYQAQILFYDPRDLAAVVQGEMKTWEPQPYAFMDLNPYLFDPEIHVERYKRDLVAATCFDRTNGLLYIMERQAEEDKNLVHVWKLKAPPAGPLMGDVNEDGKLDLEDALISLKICARVETYSPVAAGQGDINQDHRIGHAEAVYILRHLSDLR